MSNDKLKGAEALRRFGQLFDGLPEAIALLETSGSVEQAAAEAESALAARRRDIEVEDARLRARVDTALEAETRAQAVLEEANTEAERVRDEARAAAEFERASAKDDAAEIRAAATEKAKATEGRAAEATAVADDAERRAVEAEARTLAAEKALSDIRAKLEG